MCVASKVSAAVKPQQDAMTKEHSAPASSSMAWLVGAALCAGHVAFMNKAWEGESKLDATSRTHFAVPLIATALYFSMLYFGKKMMANRKPFALREYMIVYNLYQTILNAWWCYAVVKQVNHDYNGHWLESLVAPADRTANGFNLGFIIWVHYNNKMVEMLDTVFMVLRKKDRQVSFLHVYHHVLILWAWYAVCRYGGGGAAYFGGLCNSAIHVCMYGYYLLRLLNIPCPWKSHLTKAQLTQFCICMVHSFYNLYVGTYARWLAMLQLFVMVNMLVLFMDFYKKAYSKKTA